MEQVSAEMMKMLERVAAQMLRDGVTPEMFIQCQAEMAEAYIKQDVKKTERMTMAYFHNAEFRQEVIASVADMAVSQ